jgi:hypothetical protein
LKRKDKRSKEKKQREFIEAFSQYASITKACKKSKVPRRTIYDWFAAEPMFKAEFDRATEQAIGALEDEAIRRAVEGVNKPVYQGGKKVGTVKEYSDSLLHLMLKARAPERFKDRSQQELTGKGGKPLFAKADLSSLSAEELVLLATITKKLNLESTDTDSPGQGS